MIPPAESGSDGKTPPAPGTNQIAGFVEFRPLTHGEKNNAKYDTTSLLELLGFTCDTRF